MIKYGIALVHQQMALLQAVHKKLITSKIIIGKEVMQENLKLLI